MAAGNEPKDQSHRTVHSLSRDVRRRSCFSCGGMHDPNTCKFKDKLCFGCGKAGHMRRSCHQEKKADFYKTEERSSKYKGSIRFKLISI